MDSAEFVAPRHGTEIVIHGVRMRLASRGRNRSDGAAVVLWRRRCNRRLVPVALGPFRSLRFALGDALLDETQLSLAAAHRRFAVDELPLRLLSSRVLRGPSWCLLPRRDG